jgi:predicted house-cleaning noncanonical NTP pyrophosphatase (MazG superfamily)
MEDRNFQGILCQYVSEWFLISEKLASRYACVLFLLHARFEVHPTHKITAFLTWHDLLFFASVLMCHWCPQRQVQEQLKRASSKMTANSNSNNTISDLTPMMDSFVTTPLPVPAPVPVLTPMTSNETLLGTSTSSNNSAGINYGFVDNGAEIGLRVDGEWPSIGFLQEKLQPMSVRATIGADLSHKMTNSLRDLKAHLINDNETLANYRHEIMQRLGQFYEKKELEELQVKLYLIVHGVRSTYFSELYDSNTYRVHTCNCCDLFVLQFLTIGAGLSQPKELKDLLENLIVMVIRVLKDCEMKQHQLNQVFSALIE